MVIPNPQTQKIKPNPIIRLSLIGAFLTVINTLIATLALGVFQGVLVAFTTPFAFSFARLLYPRIPGATILYIPVVLVAIFTLNFGPPGPYKLLFIIGAIIYDIMAYIVGIHRKSANKIPLWKLIIPILFYPLGLLLAAVTIIQFFTIDIPFLSKGWAGAIMLMVYFGIMGSFASIIAHRIFYKWIPQTER